jgi:hypothetical protein
LISTLKLAVVHVVKKKNTCNIDTKVPPFRSSELAVLWLNSGDLCITEMLCHLQSDAAFTTTPQFVNSLPMNAQSLK